MSILEIITLFLSIDLLVTVAFLIGYILQYPGESIYDRDFIRFAIKKIGTTFFLYAYTIVVAFTLIAWWLI